MKAVRAIAIIGLICTGVLLNVQDATATRKPLRFGVNLLPMMAYRELFLTEKNDITAAISEWRDEFEEPRFAFGGSIMCAYDLSARLSVEGGFGYSLMGYQLNTDKLTFGDEVDPNRGFFYQNNIVSLRAIRYSFHYLELPLRLVLHCGSGRIRSISGIGLSTGLLLKGTITMIMGKTDGSTEKNTNESTYDFNRIGLFPSISTGVSYSVSDRIELRLEPQARYSVLRIIDAPVTARLWSAGVGFGFMWRL